MVLLNPPTERIKGAMSGLAGQVKELKKELKKPEDLLEIKILTPDWLEKLKPYLEF